MIVLVSVFNHKETGNDSKIFKVCKPSCGDDLHRLHAGYTIYQNYGRLVVNKACTKETQVWWIIAHGRVLDILNRMHINYNPIMLTPLGLVVGANELGGKCRVVIDLDWRSASLPPMRTGQRAPNMGAMFNVSRP